MAVAIGLFFGALMIHASLSRMWPRANRMLLFVVCGLGLVLAWLGGRLWVGQADLQATLSTLLIFAFLCELHLFVVGFSMTSISASLLVRLGRAQLTEDQVREDYSSQAMIEVRLQRLIEAGYVDGRDETLGVTAKGHGLIRLYQLAQRVFWHGSNGSEVPTGLRM